ncbi:MAG TPA: 5'-3' exonuclease [Nocardioidaceae bacterium]|jgi:5'-3' exonuclease
MTDGSSRLMLLDTASLYFRAFFGVPDTVRAPDGTPVNAVRGLLDFIARLVTTGRPTHLVCCWDNDWRPQWRVELISSYKAHRVEYVVADGVDVEETPDPLEAQIPMIEAVLEALGIAVVGADGYEADDVIGSLASQTPGMVDVVTGDRDLFQLVDDEQQIRVLYIARGVGNLETLTDATIVGKYGILPQQYVDFAVMRGDASDGLPGVKGVGEKTAAGLLQQYGDLAAIREAAADPTSGLATGVRSKILAAADYLDVAPKVVAVARDLKLPTVDSRIKPIGEESEEVLTTLQETWGLGGSVTRVVEAFAATSA